MTILDLSYVQKSKSIDWPTFSKYVELLILRVQYGTTIPDSEYANHVANAKQHGVPFLTYAFPEFINEADARVEAQNAISREDKASLGMVIDIEAEFDQSGNPIGITKLSPADRIAGIKAYVDELRKGGAKKVGAYIAHNIYSPWGIDAIIGIFDFIWIPKYGVNNGQPNTKPDYPCDLWQYTSVGRIAGYDGDLDLSTLNGSKTLDWFKGVEKVAIVKVVDKGEYAGKTLTVKENGLWWYNTPSWDVQDGTSNAGDKFLIIEELLVNGSRMVKCNDGKYRTADPKYVDINPKPSDWPYKVEVSGITLADAQKIVQYVDVNFGKNKAVGISL